MAPGSTGGSRAISLADNILVYGVSLLVGYGLVPMHSSKLHFILRKSDISNQVSFMFRNILFFLLRGALDRLAHLARVWDKTKSVVAGDAIIVNLGRTVI